MPRGAGAARAVTVGEPMAWSVLDVCIHMVNGKDPHTKQPTEVVHISKPRAQT
jgi:hypothetical protein